MMRREILAVVIVVAVVLLLVVCSYSDTFSADRLLGHEAAMRRFVEQRPLTSATIGMGIYVAASLIPGTTGKSVLFGWLFGFWVGILIVSCSLTLSATISLLVARYLLSDRLRRTRLSRLIQRVDETLEREGPYYLVALRLLHVPYSMLNYSAGATRISIFTFVWTTFIGLLPSSIAMVLAGSQLPTLDDFTRAGIWSVVDYRVWVALSVAAMIPLVARKIARVVRASIASVTKRKLTRVVAIDENFACEEKSAAR